MAGILCCWPHTVEHASAQVQLSGTDVVTGIDSPHQYQTNAYFKVRADLRNLALWASAAARHTRWKAGAIVARHVKGSPAGRARGRTSLQRIGRLCDRSVL